MKNPFRKSKQVLQEQEEQLVKEIITQAGQMIDTQERQSRIISDQHLIMLFLLVVIAVLSMFIIKNKLVIIR